MNKTYFNELSRVLAENDIQSGEVEHGMLPILLDGRATCRVQATGLVCITPDDLDTAEARDLYHKVAPFSEMVYEYTSLLKRAPLVQSDSGNHSYHLLAEYNGVILAGKEQEDYGCRFITWRRDSSGTGFVGGNDFGNHYAAAKQDFAIRSGLIEKGRQFTDEQLTELYRCTQDVLDGCYEITDAQREVIASAAEQIEYAVPDLKERALAADDEYRMTQQQNM